MTTYKFYAIREVGTNKFLPKFRNNAATHYELTNTQPPRLFKAVQHAKLALTAWKKGKAHMDYGDTYGIGSVFELGNEPSPALIYQPAPERESVQLEIVEVQLLVTKTCPN